MERPQVRQTGMMVCGVRVQRKVRGARAHVRLRHQFQFAQQFQRPVDGRQVDVAVDAAHLLVDLLGGHVPGHLLDGGENDGALGCHPQPALFQGFK